MRKLEFHFRGIGHHIRFFFGLENLKDKHYRWENGDIRVFDKFDPEYDKFKWEQAKKSGLVEKIANI